MITEDAGGRGWNNFLKSLATNFPRTERSHKNQNLPLKAWDQAVMVFRASSMYGWELIEEALSVEPIERYLSLL